VTWAITAFSRRAQPTRHSCIREIRVGASRQQRGEVLLAQAATGRQRVVKMRCQSSGMSSPSAAATVICA